MVSGAMVGAGKEDPVRPGTGSAAGNSSTSALRAVLGRHEVGLDARPAGARRRWPDRPPPPARRPGPRASRSARHEALDGVDRA